MILEDSLKDIDKEEEKKKEAVVSVVQGGPDSRLKKKPKKTFKRLSSHAAKDLPTKMLNAIKRHQESFLVVLLNTTESIASLTVMHFTKHFLFYNCIYIYGMRKSVVIEYA